MDVCLAIKRRLGELALEQRDLAAAAKVTESYISQLLTGKKLPPEPSRTDIYEKIGKFLKLPSGKLSRLAEHQRKEVLKRNLEDPPKALLKEVRELILRKCAPGKEKQIRVIFEKQPFGELERLVTQKLLDVVKTVAKDELESETWLQSVARLSGRMATFGMEIVLNRRLIPGYARKFEFVEREPSETEEEPGLGEFLRQSVNGGATEEEVDFLRRLRFKGKHPTPLYYYRELQNLRDPLHFREDSSAAMRKRRDPDNVERQMQLDSRKRAIQGWANSKIAPGKRNKQ